MDNFHELRKWEYIHIPLWLIKDSCWMMEWKVLGITMIVPTVLVAVLITYKSVKQNEFFINLAITFWICANAYWMTCEFVGHVELKYYAAIPFVMGIVATVVFYLRRIIFKKN